MNTTGFTIVCVAAAIWASAFSPVGGDVVSLKSPTSVVLEYNRDENDLDRGKIALRLELDNLSRFKLVSLAYDHVKMQVPLGELAGLFNPDLSKVVFIRDFDEKLNQIVWTVELPFDRRITVCSEVKFVFVGESYSHLVIREPVNENEWRVLKKQPGKGPVVVGTESRIPGVDSNGAHKDGESQPVPGAKPGAPTSSGREPRPPEAPAPAKSKEGNL